MEHVEGMPTKATKLAQLFAVAIGGPCFVVCAVFVCFTGLCKGWGTTTVLALGASVSGFYSLVVVAFFVMTVKEVQRRAVLMEAWGIRMQDDDPESHAMEREWNAKQRTRQSKTKRKTKQGTVVPTPGRGAVAAGDGHPLHLRGRSNLAERWYDA